MSASKDRPKIQTKSVASKWHTKSPKKGVAAAAAASSVLSSPQKVFRRTLPKTSAGRPLQVINELATNFDLTLSDVASVLDVSPKTVTRWQGRDSALSEQQADRMMVLKSIFDLGRQVLGTDANLKKWIHEPVFSLDGQTPLKLLKTESGRRRVESVLHQIEYGFYSLKNYFT